MRPCSRVLLVVLALALLAPAAARAQTPIGTLHCNDATGVTLMNGQVVTVRGIVTAQEPAGANTRLYIQDATGGVNIFGAPQYCGSLGDDITVTGTVGQFNGLVEVASTSTAALIIVVNSVGNPQPTPLAQTIAQANATYQANNCEPNESLLEGLSGVLIRTSTGAMPPAVFAANTNYRLESNVADSSTNFIIMRIVQSANNCGFTLPLVGMAIPATPSCVVGVLSQFTSTAPFNSGYEVLPRIPDDIVGNCLGAATRVRGLTWGQLKRTYH